MTISLLLSQGKRHTKQCQSAGADFVGAEATDRSERVPKICMSASEFLL